MAQARVETRVSLVLYGGVSLAVYISGTCQEWLSVVRATTDVERDDLTAVERVYRELAQRSGAHGIPMKVTVDVLSGSSAGGLNAVFLGKALSHGGGLDQLTEVWRNEADFLKLLDDADAPPLEGLAPTLEPRSLLNGDRFYELLRRALDAMEPGTEADRLVPMVDCYLTTTDLRGIAESVQVHGSNITELRRRARFHFSDGVVGDSDLDRSDLAAAKNQLLAFASRATAAHPAAFAPAQWQRIEQELINATTMPVRANLEPNRSPLSDVDVEQRWYSDGGDMDNKPFQYALEPLTMRRATTPVERRVVYVEPNPARTVDGWEKVGFPSLWAYTGATYGLGRTENIHEDVAAFARRNESVARLDTSLRALFRRPDADIEASVRARLPDNGRSIARSGLTRAALVDKYARGTSDQTGVVGNWTSISRAEFAAQRGWGAVAIEDFRWNSVVTDLVTTALQVGNQAPDAALIAEIAPPMREGIERWIQAHPEAGTGEVNAPRVGLYWFDSGFRLRRFTLIEHLLSTMQQDMNHGASSTPHDMRLDDRFDQCRRARAAINKLYIELRATVERQRRDDLGTELLAATTRRPDGSLDLTHLFVDGQNTELFGELMNDTRARLDVYLESSSNEARDAIAEAAIDCDIQLRLTDAWINYGDYDQLILPLAETADAELDAAEVIRISPLDARSLIDESIGTDPAAQRRKLGGTALKNFGGFLDQDWRLNDILWGRLDTAEVLVRNVLGSTRGSIDEQVARVHRAHFYDLADQVAHHGVDGSPLGSLLRLNAAPHESAHAAAHAALDAVAAIDLPVRGRPLREHREQFDRLADAYIELMHTWDVDRSTTGAREQRKVELLRRGARMVGRVLAAPPPPTDDDPDPSPSAGLAYAGRMVSNSVGLALGDPLRRWLLAFVLFVVGVGGAVATAWISRSGVVVVLLVIGGAAAMIALIVISFLSINQLSRSATVAWWFVAAALVAWAGVINLAAAASSVLFLLVLTVSAVAALGMGWLRQQLIKLN